jgi:hypothetical protein
MKRPSRSRPRDDSDLPPLSPTPRTRLLLPSRPIRLFPHLSEFCLGCRQQGRLHRSLLPCFHPCQAGLQRIDPAPSMPLISSQHLPFQKAPCYASPKGTSVASPSRLALTTIQLNSSRCRPRLPKPFYPPLRIWNVALHLRSGLVKFPSPAPLFTPATRPSNSIVSSAAAMLPTTSNCSP